jgi:hypothetical protein
MVFVNTPRQWSLLTDVCGFFLSLLERFHEKTVKLLTVVFSSLCGFFFSLLERFSTWNCVSLAYVLLFVLHYLIVVFITNSIWVVSGHWAPGRPCREPPPQGEPCLHHRRHTCVLRHFHNTSAPTPSPSYACVAALPQHLAVESPPRHTTTLPSSTLSPNACIFFGDRFIC